MGDRKKAGMFRSKRGHSSGYTKTSAERSVKLGKFKKPVFSTLAQARPEFVKRLNSNKQINKIIVALGFIALTALAIVPACQLVAS